MRMRDRTAALSAFILFTDSLALLLWGVLLVGSLFTAFPVPNPTPTVEALLWINFGFMIWRMAMRAIFAGLAYGWAFGLGAIPRKLIGKRIDRKSVAKGKSVTVRVGVGGCMII